MRDFMPTKRQWAAGSKLGDKTLWPGSMNAVDRRAVIRLVREINPKTVGSRSRKRYALYRDGMTVGDYLAAVEGAGEQEQAALNALAWDQNHGFVRVDEPSSEQVWSVAEAKAKLSEILRLARTGEPQTIGSEDPCVVISAEQFEQLWQSQHLGKFLVESAPRGAEFELPSRRDDRENPFSDH
jgi:prevent-host-death family protein